MSLGSHCSDPKRIKLDLNDSVVEPGTSSTNGNNSNFDDIVSSPSDTCENTSIISAFDHDSSSILSGSFYESSCEVLLTDISTTKGILKYPESSIFKNSLKRNTKKIIKFHEIEIFYFNRQQSFCSVPSLGGSALGMEMQHFLSEKLRFDSDIDEYITRKKYDSSSYEKVNKYLKEDYSILQPIVAKHRRILLKNSGTSRIETVDKEVCDLIRSSRERCGCQCVAGHCVPETCTCAQNGIQCQVDRGNFPCCCGPNPCANPLGRVEFNPIRVRTHFIHTIMRLQMQDQYQSDEPKELMKNSESKRFEIDDNDTRPSKDFDINQCNSTDQGSCRDCQNDKYLHVLMNEWTNQLQKLHTSKHYAPSVSIPYNSWSYFPETFCPTTYCDKDTAPFHLLPYSQYTVSNIPALNFGLTQPLNYHRNITDLQYPLSTSSYSSNSIDGNFSIKPSVSNFPVLQDEELKSMAFNKHPVQDESTLKDNPNCDSTKINNQMTYTYPSVLPEKSSLYTRYPYDKGSTFLCKYITPVCGVQSDLKELGYNASAYVNTVPFSTIRENRSQAINNHCESLLQTTEPEPTSLIGHDKITHASNGQLYTVLQPVSQSGIVTTFYRNSQASELCKICKYKSPDGNNRQQTDHLCISEFSLAATNNHQSVPIKCTDKSEVCA